MYRQKAVCEQEGVPFQSKIDMAVNQIEDFEPVADTHTHVLVDSWYHCKRVRKAAQKRGWDVSGGLKSNRVMRLIAEDGSREWLKLSEYAARLDRDDWQEVIWPSAQYSANYLYKYHNGMFLHCHCERSVAETASS